MLWSELFFNRFHYITYSKLEKGKPGESQGRKVSGLRVQIYDSGTAGQKINCFFGANRYFYTMLFVDLRLLGVCRPGRKARPQRPYSSPHWQCQWYMKKACLRASFFYAFLSLRNLSGTDQTGYQPGVSKPANFR